MDKVDKKDEIIKLLNGSLKVVGSKQVLRSLSEGGVRCVIMSEDADGELRERLAKAAAERKVEILVAPSMEWLGEQAGIEVGAAAVGVLEPEV